MGNLIIDYYYGAYGKTLLMRIDDVAVLSRLRDIFGRLADNTINKFNLRDIANIEFRNIDDVVMTNNSTYVYIKKEKNIVYWEQTETDWYNCEGLIKGLIEGAKTKRGGHQYFTGSEDGIIVEISENE